MAKIALLNNVEHQDVKLNPAYGADHGGGVNQMLIYPSEFEEIQREFPILFRKDDEGRFFSVALLGFDRDENLFLAQDQWVSHYIPAMSKTGPFSIGLGEAAGGQSEPAILIDMDDGRIGRDSGLPLFLTHGGNSPYLNQIMAALQIVYHGPAENDAMFAVLQELQLVAPLQLQVRLSEDDRIDFSDVFAVSAQRFAQMHGAELERLHRAGFLGAALWMLSSLENINRLIALKQTKMGA
ncbi:MAG: SapC family protein [Sphingomonadales bacterium]|nr:SapC family protein [Sphingomonadales bacterium]